MSKTLTIHVEFFGGLEALFSNKRNHDLELPISAPNTSSSKSPGGSLAQWTVTDLIGYLYTHFLKDSPKAELFIMDGTVRPGILVLINDADWELEGEGEYQLKTGDTIVFVSTLHGG